jgi:hypothetical protein
MIEYDDDARVTLAEFCDWAEQTPAHVRECEAKGIIARDENGLFELLPTIRAMAHSAEQELAELKRTHVRTPKGWVMLFWRAPVKGLGWLRRWLELQAGRALNWLWPIR